MIQTNPLQWNQLFFCWKTYIIIWIIIIFESEYWAGIYSFYELFEEKRYLYLYAADIVCQSFENLITTLDLEQKEIIILRDLICDISAHISERNCFLSLKIFNSNMQIIKKTYHYGVIENSYWSNFNDLRKIAQSGVMRLLLAIIT